MGMVNLQKHTYDSARRNMEIGQFSLIAHGFTITKHRGLKVLNNGIVTVMEH